MKSLNFFVGRLGSFQINLRMRQKQPLPALRHHWAFQVPQCIQGEFMVCAVRMGGIDDPEKKVHGAFPGGAASIKSSNAGYGIACQSHSLSRGFACEYSMRLPDHHPQFFGFLEAAQHEAV